MPRGRRWRWRIMREGPGRPFGYLRLSNIPDVKQFRPVPMGNPEPVELTYPEYETLVLADFKEMKQEDVAKNMKTSRGTVWRLLTAARKKVAKALKESRPLLISQKGEIEEV